LATNVTAISFIARRVSLPRYVLLSGICYTIGQACAFILLSAALVSGLLTVPLVSHWLQKYLFRLLGPVLIVCALFLLQWLVPHWGRGRLKAWVQQWAGDGGLWAAALLGIVFAMSFCPTTAALIFGSMLPLAIARESSVLIPLVYAVGVALPVISFSLVIAFAAHRVGLIFERIGSFERYARNGTGAIFLLVGIYFTLAYTLGLF
ncbi:MAG: sulfite exporter TauE/SafE family protein, partial [Candidatus Hydrogenedentes bacterium]|nr:sulfite exporter TauE/SafE family protein [Candidatus Hydrogenedentota bacterium]